jgi:hypothetical protein
VLCPLSFFGLVFGLSGHVINICRLKHLDVCKLKCLLFISAVVLFCLPRSLWRTSAGKVSFARVAYRQSGEGEGPYPTGGVGYLRLALLRPLAASVPREFTPSLGRDILSTFATSFAKNGTSFLGGAGAPPPPPRPPGGAAPPPPPARDPLERDGNSLEGAFGSRLR